MARAPLLAAYECVLHTPAGAPPPPPAFARHFRRGAPLPADGSLAATHVPRTLYTLAFLRGYLYERPSLPFVALGSAEDPLRDFGLPLFLHDLHTQRTPVTVASLTAAVSEWEASPQVQRVHFAVNEALVLLLQQVCGCNDGGSHPAPGGPGASPPLPATLGVAPALAMATALLEDLAAVAAGQQTDVSREYDAWPLLRPGLEAAFLDAIESSEDVEEQYDCLVHAYGLYVNACIAPLAGALRRFLLHFPGCDVAGQEVWWLRICTMVRWCGGEEEETEDGDTTSPPPPTPTEHDNHGPRSEPPDLMLPSPAGGGDPPITGSAVCTVHLQLVRRHAFPALTMFLAGCAAAGDRAARLAAVADLYAALAGSLATVDNAAGCFRDPAYLSHADAILSVVRREAELATAEGAFLLFRGGPDPMGVASHGEPGAVPPGPYSVSYGAALFSGVLADASAVPYSALRQAAALPGLGPPGAPAGHGLQLWAADEAEWGRWLFVPPVPVLAQLAGLGELYHPRTKVAVDSVPAAAPVAGVFRCPARRLPAFLHTYRDPLPLWEALVAPHRFDLLPGGRTMAAPEDGSAAPLPALCCRIAYEEAWLHLCSLPPAALHYLLAQHWPGICRHLRRYVASGALPPALCSPDSGGREAAAPGLAGVARLLAEAPHTLRCCLAFAILRIARCPVAPAQR